MSIQSEITPYRPDETPSDSIDLIDLLNVLRRYTVSGAVIAGFLFLGILLLYFQQDTVYRAMATVVIDARSPDPMGIDGLQAGDPTGEIVETESRIIASRHMAESVRRNLGLKLSDFETPKEAKLPFAGVGGLFAKPDDGPRRTEAEEREAIIDTLLHNLRVQREGESYAISISYDAISPGLSARIANGFAEAYIDSQTEDSTSASADANSKLSERLDKLEANVESAERAVEEFRKEKGLIEADGSMLDEREVSSLQTQLVEAENQLDAVRAEYETAALMAAQGRSVDELSAALDSGIMNDLRRQYVELQREAKTLRERYKSGHPELIRVEGELSEVKSYIDDELARIVGNLRSNLEIAQARVNDIRSRANRAQTRIRQNQSDQVKLRELERQAESAAQIYEDFLTRLNEINAQEGFQQSEARIISPATAPYKPASPKPALGVALAASLSLAGTFLVIAITELLVGGIRSPGGLSTIAGAPCVVSLPRGRELLSTAQLGKRKPRWSYLRNIHVLHDDLLERIANKPTEKHGYSVAFCSPTPKDGRTQAALSLSQLSASLGKKTLVVKFELTRNVFLSHISRDESGVFPKFEGEIDFNVDVINAGEGLPDVLSISLDGTGERKRLTSEEVNEIIEQLVKRYELVVFDVPPLLDSAEASWFARSVDFVYLTIAARKTPTKAISACVQLVNRGTSQISGSILTGVDHKMIA